MCGIFGLSINEQSGFNRERVRSTITRLFKLSESRGKEAAGLAISNADTIDVYKDSIPASTLLRTDVFKKWFQQTLLQVAFDKQGRLVRPLTIMGHSRLVTNGAMEIHGNNQPVISSGIVGIHNGIIVNDEKLWKAFPMMQRNLEVDTEVLLGLLRHYYQETGDIKSAVQQTFHQIEGTASIAVLFEDLDLFVLATNNGSLYVCQNKTGSALIFASEKYILKNLLEDHDLRTVLGEFEMRQIIPGSGCVIDLQNTHVEMFDFEASATLNRFPESKVKSRKIIDFNPNGHPEDSASFNSFMPSLFLNANLSRFDIDVESVRSMKRCTRCVLPETMPFIEFDEQGVCNYCRTYQKLDVPGEDALRSELEPYRSKNGDPDCLVALSGGRDSSYGLHYMKEVLGMHPIAYTYDWGMVTDLARRNQARLCGKLKIEHILVSADIKKKRQYIRQNVLAWLKRPTLGTVPLFMAGDKQFFSYANKLKEQTGAKITILCINPLERTSFKTSFCGVKQPEKHYHHYALSVLNQVKLGLYYGKEYLLNPAYINSSIWDTMDAFVSYYMIPHTFLNLFNYIPWDEGTTNSTLIGKYNWETALDTRSTWRIGDGTASFYNYIYYSVAGFTENDTFRSNQIREGIIDRETALEKIYEENQPRYESIQWYCNTIGVDMGFALERIKSIQKLY